MNSKDLRLGGACAALVLLALWPAWANARRLVFNFGDLQTYHYPLRHLVVEALQRGRLPFWNPYLFSGLPLAANPQAQLLYPLAALAAFWPLTAALSWDMTLHLFWALLGMALLARRGGLRAPAAWTLGVLYAFGPFVLYRVVEGIPTLLAALAWAPWCWLAWSSGKPALLGAAWALQLLSGHPQFLVINAAGMVLWALCGAAPLRAAALFLRAGLWSLGLTAAQWAPTLEFLGRSVRRAWPAAYSLGYSLEPAALLSLLWPGAFGDPVAGTYAGPPSVFFETGALWIGLLGLAAAACGLALRRRRAGAVALLAVGVLLALGSNGPLGAAGLSALRTPSRWLLLALWSLLLCAGTALGWAGRRGRRGVAVALLALAAVELGAWDARFLGAVEAGPFLKANERFARLVGGSTWRLITAAELASPNKTALYHARNANGYEAFYLDGYPQYVSRSEGKPAADASRTYLDKLNTPELDRLAVMWRVGAAGIDDAKSPQPLAFFVDGADRVVTPYPLMIYAQPEHWRVGGAWPRGAARLVLSQPSYPGWAARLGGARAPIELWDGLLQSVARPSVADGTSVALDLRFTPTGWPWLIAATLLCWAAWLRGLRSAW